VAQCRRLPAPIHAYVPFADFLRPLLEKQFPGREVVCWARPEDFAEGIPEVEFLYSLRPPRDQWARARKLRMIQCLGAGVDDLLPAEGLPERVVIANNRGMSAEPMAEFGLALVLGLVKKLPVFLDGQRAHEWRRTLPGVVAGRTLGILGLGAIGLALAVKAHALGMRVIGTQRRPKSHPAVERIYGPEQTEEVLASSDAVVVLLPLTPRTRGSLTRERLARLRPSAFLVNLARGGIVDEQALAAMLREGTLAGAAFDVFEQEPLPETSPLWDVPNLWITPHMAGGFPDLLDLSLAEFADNVARLERGEQPVHVVDREAGY
jgi:phosphoglycerate dehydrogenase-like enzyme